MSFAQTLLNWYQVNKRDLPWRSTNDPYIIWLSEVILQQTRVDQGLPYFHRFSENYPTVDDFAQATEDEILRHWQGLGYYSRGRNMHKTARMVMEEHAGYFPRKYDELIRLKGIGEYTAAAISSFSAGEPRAVVDGNVYRVLSRYFGISVPVNSSKGKKIFSDLAGELLDRDQPALFNQAIMEFGALQCKPRNPDCAICPLRMECIARRENLIRELPVKIKANPPRARYFNYLILANNGRLAMQKRETRDIWQNLYEFPLIETPEPAVPSELLQRPEFRKFWGGPGQAKAVTGPVIHQLSHQKIHAQFIEVAGIELSDNQSVLWKHPDETEGLAVPKLISDFLKNYLS
ncbi:MAG TPA: A/G-specific adenine glycosylase [Sphingobacteriaceae bacterium]